MNISVIIPTYNRQQLLLKCLTQLAQQNFPKELYEVIVVSDGIDEETKIAVVNFSEQQLFFNLGYYNLNEKKGPAAARNCGVQYAKGELIVFTDDDCLPQPDWLRTYWKAYENANEKETAFTGQTIVPHSKTPTDYEKNIANLQIAEFITANCAVTKNTFEKVNGFDEQFTTAWREDSDLHFKLIESSILIQKINSAVVIHPVRKATWSISLKEQKKSLFNALLFKKHKSLYKQKINQQPVWNYYLMILFFSIGIVCLLNSLGVIAITSFIVWFTLVFQFVLKRLQSTSRSLSHIAEMILTSMLIPFLSVFWTLYGSFKYKTFFL